MSCLIHELGPSPSQTINAEVTVTVHLGCVVHNAHPSPSQTNNAEVTNSTGGTML